MTVRYICIPGMYFYAIARLMLLPQPVPQAVHLVRRTRGRGPRPRGPEEEAAAETQGPGQGEARDQARPRQGEAGDSGDDDDDDDVLLQEDMIADLVRLLGSGTVDTNTVANYFLAQQLLAALSTMKEETTQTILIKVQIPFLAVSINLK